MWAVRGYRNLNARCMNIQKQPLRGVLRKRCSEDMQQIYGRTSMPKCDFNKVAKSRWKSNKYTFQGHKKNKNKASDAELKIKCNLTWAFCQHQTLQAIFSVMQRVFAFETISTDSLSCIEQNIKSNKNGWSIKDIKIITKLIS